MSATLAMNSGSAQGVCRIGGDEAVQPSIPRYINFKALRGSKRKMQLSVGTERSMAGLYALEAEWRALEQCAQRGVSVFQSFDWCAAWCETYVSERNEAEIHIVTVRDGDRLVMVWPLMTTCAGPFCVLRWLSEPYGQYGDVLADPEYARTEVFEAAWQQIVATSMADTIRLRHVRKDALAHDFLLAKCEIAGLPDQAPYLDMTALKNEADYDARYNKSQRRRRTRIRSSLEKIGPVKFAVRSDPDFLDSVVELAVRHKRQWLDERGLYSEPVKSDGFASFLTRLAKRGGNSLNVITSQLMAGDEALSHQVALQYFGRHLCYLTAHDSAYTNLSPARLHMDMSQRAALALQTQAFDLMVPGDPYKLTWSSDTVEVCDFYAALNFKGRVFGFGYLSTIRPVMRKVYQATPMSLRRKVVRLY